MIENEFVKIVSDVLRSRGGMHASLANELAWDIWEAFPGIAGLSVALTELEGEES